MEEFFDFTGSFPDPVLSDGMAVNGSDSDYGYSTGATGGIRIFNDSNADGDTLLFLQQKPNASGVFGSGFAQDLYVFDENFDRSGGKPDLVERSIASNPNEGSASEFSYTGKIPVSAASQTRFAVVLIQDNERVANGTLRRTTLGNGNDTIEFLFDNKDDTILAGGGNDIVRSGGGNDIVFGEAGNDQIFGGEGTNYLFGGFGNDSLTGGSGKDWLDGGTGDDRLEGTTGNDIYIVDSYGDQIIESPMTGIETVQASLNWTLEAGSGLDHLLLTGNAIVGKGNSLNNFIRGNNLANTLEGGDGDDILFGDEVTEGVFDFELDLAPGDYHFVVFPEDFLPYVNANGIQNRYFEKLLQIQTNDPNFAGNDVLRGGDGNDTLFGWGGNDQLFGDAGNDRLDGGLGADRLEGGGGDDTYVIDNLNDLIIEAPQTGIETIESSITFDLNQYSMAVGSPVLAASGLDNLTLIKSYNPGVQELVDSAIDGFGNYLPNTLIGNDAANTLDGRGGNDIVDGRGGNDILIVSEGTDTLIGGLGTDKFRFNQLLNSASKPTIQDFKPGEDLIEISSSGFSNPTLSQFSFNGTDLLFGSQAIAKIQSSSPFNLAQSLQFI
jgi:Ca2+-binding RTX toxin-like protein